MGVCIDLYKYRLVDFESKLRAQGCTGNDKMLRQILEACGVIIGEWYALLNNEHYDENNPYYELPELLDSAFPGSEDSFDVILEEGEDTNRGAVETSAIAERLGFKIKEGY